MPSYSPEFPRQSHKTIVQDLIQLMNGRAKTGQAYEPTDVEHIANVVTHGLWIVPSLAGLVYMQLLSDNTREVLIAGIYGLAVLTLFTVSTVFHTISYIGRFRQLKNFFHIGDRAVIYLFIAASYTPWLTLRDLEHWGYHCLWIVWVMAVIGIWYQYTYHEQYKWLETLFYFIIGVCPAISWFAMKETSGTFELVTGGIVYISGVVFFKCDGLVPFAHAIWHCFVFVGAIFHYIAVCRYLLGPESDQALVMVRAVKMPLKV
ncbi:monocyte to macrophage differentiation factor 2-like isoform X2 [Lineus longissimus]|uniref:monocyte to macrophage differentiation factor 2-like isoform X2 n=1 Tax=Lineus longissimus TaxID=88925 RepID=UPI00315D0425